MLNDTMLDNKLWGNAFLTAVYVRNGVWSQGSQCIPYQAVFEKLPNLSNLRVFGCQAFSHSGKSKQRKLVHKSLEGIIVGYASNRRACLIYKPNTRSITRADCVVVNEQWKASRQGLLRIIVARWR